MLNKNNQINHLGEVYGELTILKCVGGGKYLCKCSCDKLKEVRLSDMRRGRTKSCGHLKKSKELDIVGQKFNKLMVLERTTQNNKGHWLFLCKCDCGVLKELVGKEVKRGKIKSCGNHNVEAVKKANTTHGETKTRLYYILRGAIQRCTNPNVKAYKDYGGRGITVCEEWAGEGGYLQFKSWALSKGYKPHLTLERKDVNKGYSPDNCTWATTYEQAVNKQGTVYATLNGETRPLITWCEALNLNYQSVWKRINKYNYTPEKALTYNTHRLSPFKKF